MAKKKTYYFLKMSDDFFKSKEIKLLRKNAGGDTYALIYQRIMILSLMTDGKLYFENIGTSFAEEVALELDETVENVKMTLAYLQGKKLIEFSEVDNSYELVQVPSLVGSETNWARYKAMSREAGRNCLPDVNQESTYIEKESEIDKDKELDKDKESEQQKNSSSNPLAILSDFYQGNFGVINPLVLDDLNHSLNDFGVELTLEAMKRTLRNQKPFSYSLRILNAWAKNNIKTLADVQADDAKFERAKGKGKNSKVVKQAPEWSQKKYVDNTSDQQKAEFEAYKAKRKETKDASS